MIDKIINKFCDRDSKSIVNYKKSSVMILLQEIKGEIFIIFEVRANSLIHQPGDICLPGGKCEKGEEPIETAFRETSEELNIEREDIDFLGTMDYLITPYGALIYVFVSKLNTEEILPNPSEVDHIIKIPLDYFIKIEPMLYEMQIGPYLKEDFPYELVNGGRNYNFSKGVLPQYFYTYNGYNVWGVTARIVKHFIDIIKES